MKKMTFDEWFRKAWVDDWLKPYGKGPQSLKDYYEYAAGLRSDDPSRAKTAPAES